jgi:hypothetical protein
VGQRTVARGILPRRVGLYPLLENLKSADREKWALRSRRGFQPAIHSLRPRKSRRFISIERREQFDTARFSLLRWHCHCQQTGLAGTTANCLD